MIDPQDDWRTEYSAYRYLEHLGTAELRERGDELLLNLLWIPERGPAWFLDTSNVREVRRRLVHLSAELALRDEKPLDDSKGAAATLVAQRYPNARGSFRALGDRQFPSGTLFRFVSQPWASALIDRGSVRLRPATSYDDSTLSPAQQDDELRFHKDFPAGSKLSVRSVEDGEWLEVRGLTRATHTRAINTDYLVLCLAREYLPRYFDDFRADACVAIRDADEFGARLLAALKERDFGSWRTAAAGVSYYDPLHVDRDRPPFQDEPNIPFLKHLRYAYQQEWRFAFLPPEPADSLDPVELEIGPLTDIAELIELPAT